MPLSSRQTEHYHLLQQLAEVVIVEGEGADQEGVQDDAAGPHVGPGPVILLTLQQPEGEMRKMKKNLLHCLPLLQRVQKLSTQGRLS